MACSRHRWECCVIRLVTMATTVWTMIVKTGHQTMSYLSDLCEIAPRLNSNSSKTWDFVKHFQKLFQELLLHSFYGSLTSCLTFCSVVLVNQQAFHHTSAVTAPKICSFIPNLLHFSSHLLQQWHMQCSPVSRQLPPPLYGPVLPPTMSDGSPSPCGCDLGTCSPHRHPLIASRSWSR